MPEINLMF